MSDLLHRNKNNANAYCHELAFQEIFLKVFLVLSSFVFAEFDRQYALIFQLNIDNSELLYTQT